MVPGVYLLRASPLLFKGQAMPVTTSAFRVRFSSSYFFYRLFFFFLLAERAGISIYIYIDESIFAELLTECSIVG